MAMLSNRRLALAMSSQQPAEAGSPRGGVREAPASHGATMCCMSPKQKQDWVYVGEGQGRYSVVLEYDYVGEGRGRFSKEGSLLDALPLVRRCCCQALSVGLCLAILLVVVRIATALLKLAVPQPGGEGAKSHSSTTFPPAPAPAPHELGAGTSLPFDCLSEAVGQWSAGKRGWCCTYERRGCPEPVPVSALYDCDAGHARWESAWSIGKRVWCCYHVERGCPAAGSGDAKPPPPREVKLLQSRPAVSPTTSTTSAAARPAERAAAREPRGRDCAAQCPLNGTSATCRSQIQSVARDRFPDRSRACLAAFFWVLQHCHACSGCTFATAGCE